MTQLDDMKKRLTDLEFFSILRENAGLYARTARAIEKQFGISYTRQAVKDRADKSPEILLDIEEENLDIAEEGLHSLMRSKNESIKFRAIESFLKTKGKSRGYVERVEQTAKDGGELYPKPRVLSKQELKDYIKDIESEY